MFKRLGGLLLKDFKVASRNYFLIIVVAVAALLVLVTNFLIPKSLNSEVNIIYYIEGNDVQQFSSLLKSLESSRGNVRVESRENLLEKLKADKNSIGMVLKQDSAGANIEFVMQGYESEKTKNALRISMGALLQGENVNTNNISYTRLNTAEIKEIPFNKLMVPLMIFTEPVMLGFIFIATLIFMEKEEEVTKAYMISPGKIPEYLASKIILVALLGVISTFIITMATVGFNVNWILLMLLVIVGSVFGSVTGLLLASFFDNISSAMIWILAVSLILSAPQAAYFIPGFSPAYITVMPTYSMMFAIKETVFPSGNTAIVYSALLTTGIISMLLYALSIVSYSRALSRD